MSEREQGRDRADRRSKAARPQAGRQARRKQDKRFGSRMQKKLAVLYVMILLAFAGLSIQLIRIAGDKEDEYTRQILSQRQYDSTTIPFRRGDIVDANGTQLAVSENVYNLILDIKVIREKEKLEKKDYMEPTLRALDQFLIWIWTLSVPMWLPTRNLLTMCWPGVCLMRPSASFRRP